MKRDKELLTGKKAKVLKGELKGKIVQITGFYEDKMCCLTAENVGWRKNKYKYIPLKDLEILE